MPSQRHHPFARPLLGVLLAAAAPATTLAAETPYAKINAAAASASITV